MAMSKALTEALAREALNVLTCPSTPPTLSSPDSKEDVPVVRMKVKCTRRTESLGSHWNPETKAHDPVHLFGYEFAFVSGSDSPENEAFWSATPNGSFRLDTVLQDAFELGGYYYIDATLAPDQSGRAYS